MLETVKGKVTAAPISAMVLCQDDNASGGISGGVVAGIVGTVAVLGVAAAVIMKKKKK